MGKVRKFKAQQPVANQQTFNKNQVAAIIGELMANSSDDLRTRLSRGISGGYDDADTMHNVYNDFGYPEDISFAQFWNMYRRFGIAKNVIELAPDSCWMDAPTVEGSDKFNSDLALIVKSQNLWVRTKGLDLRQRVGRYAGMFMRVRDGLTPDQPLEDGSLSGIGSLVQMIPLYESQLEVVDTEDDVMSDDYDQPTMYQFSGSAEGSRSDSAASFQIHPSRLVLAAEGADDGSIYGIPEMEACYNSLMDLRKIIGAGGEGFYKNASKDVIFELDKDANAAMLGPLLKNFSEEYDEWAQNRMRRSLMAPGMKANTLDSTLANPKEYFFNALYDISACTKIPATIIIGQQTGRLASSEDAKSFMLMMKSRQENFLNEMIGNIIDWLIKFGIIPFSEYEITWPDLLAPSDQDKLSNAKEMAGINETQFRSGQGVVFEPEEIKDAAGFGEEDDLPVPDETLPVEDDAV